MRWALRLAAGVLEACNASLLGGSAALGSGPPCLWEVLPPTHLDVASSLPLEQNCCGIPGAPDEAVLFWSTGCRVSSSRPPRALQGDSPESEQGPVVCFATLLPLGESLLHVPNQGLPVPGAHHHERRGLEVPHLQPGQPRLRRAQGHFLRGGAVLRPGGPAAPEDRVQVGAPPRAGVSVGGPGGTS